jgi:hypothetical protein
MLNGYYICEVSLLRQKPWQNCPSPYFTRNAYWFFFGETFWVIFAKISQFVLRILNQDYMPDLTKSVNYSILLDSYRLLLVYKSTQRKIKFSNSLIIHDLMLQLDACFRVTCIPLDTPIQH